MTIIPTVSKVERYYTVIRRAYFIIITKLHGINKDIALQMSFKAINDSVGPDGIVPTLLVYGAYPRMVKSDPLSLTVLQRATIVKKAMTEIRKLQAKRQVNDALNTRNGLNTFDIHELPLNSDVLV